MLTYYLKGSPHSSLPDFSKLKTSVGVLWTRLVLAETLKGKWHNIVRVLYTIVQVSFKMLFKFQKLLLKLCGSNNTTL